MNEILAIISKNKNSEIQEFSLKAFQIFKEKFANITDEINDDTYRIIVASKTHLTCHIHKIAGHITCIGGYLLNEPSEAEINNYKPECFHGKFVFIDINTDSNQILIYNDALGHFPVFYVETESFFCISSDLTFLLYLSGINKTLEPQHVADYFFWGSTLPGTTFFKNINLLPPASKLVFEKTYNYTLTEYKPETCNYNFKNIHESAETINIVLGDVIKAYYDYYGKISFSLTGGLDTRLIAGYTKDLGNIDFFSIRSPIIPDNINSDITIAKEVAKFLKLPHNIISNLYFPYPLDFNPDYFKYKTQLNSPPIGTGLFASEIFRLQALDILHPYLVKQFIKIRGKELPFIKLSFNGFPELKYFLKRLDKSSFDFSLITMNHFDLKLFKSRVNKKKKYYSNLINTSHVDVFSSWLSRSYYSNYYGGSRAGNFNHTGFFSNFLMPFVDQKFLNVLSSIPLNFFGIHNNSLYVEIYKTYFKQLLKIPTNSSIPQENTNVFNVIQSEINPLNHKVNNDILLLNKYKRTSGLFDLDVFDKTSLLKSMRNSKKIKESFIDFSVWIDYVNSIV